VKAGYHVTEVKAGAFSAPDCGANPEAWSEMFIQLWDIVEHGRGHVPAGKFSAIIRKSPTMSGSIWRPSSPSRSAMETSRWRYVSHRNRG